MRSSIKRFFRFLIMAATMGCHMQAMAQNDSLPKEPALFYKQISHILLDTKRTSELNKANKLLVRLNTIQTSGRFNKNVQAAIWQLTENLQQKKVRPYPFLYDYFYSLTLLAESSLSGADILAWHRYGQELVNEKKLKPFLDFMKFTKNLMEKHQIFGRASSAWFYRNGSFKIHFDSVFSIKFSSLTLVKASKYDSSSIHHTQGIYFYQKKQWTGHGGQLSWSRFKAVGDKRQASFGNYILKLSNNTITFDSVLLHEHVFLNRDIRGQLTDKVFSGRANANTPYPHFISYANNLLINNLYPEIQFRGAIEIKGDQLFGVSRNNVKPVFYFKHHQKTILQLKANHFKINTDKLVASHVEFMLPLERDSIYHPNLQLRYTAADKQLILYTMANGGTQIPFFDSYHQMDLYVPSLFWKMNTDSLIFKKIRGVNNNLNARFESTRYFSNKEFYRLQGIDEVNPLYVIKNFSKTYDTLDVSAAALAGFIQKPIDQAVAMLLKLSNHGFVVYNAGQQKARIKKRLSYFLDAKARRTDFDVIHFTSDEKRKANASLNLQNLSLNIYGVPRIFISDSQHVYIYPYDKQIAIHKNRDFSFNGKVSAGLFNFYARQSTFVYDSFMINMNDVDSLTFSIVKTDTIRNRKNIIHVKNKLRHLNGRLYVDLPFNKSGVIDAPKFPVFVSESESYVYFNRRSIQDSTLIPERFYYRIDPFTFDSLMTFNTNGLSFKGELYSDSLFPPIAQPLRVMPDYSLGFKYKSPDNGLPLYAGRGTFYDTINLSNHGFTGNGKLAYLTTTSHSSQYIFYPDSLVAHKAFRFKGAADSIQYNFPAVGADSVQLAWDIPKNQMQVISLETNGIELYNNSHLKGVLDITPSSMQGHGNYFFDRSEIISKRIDFACRKLEARSADFILRNPNKTDTAFFAKNYQAQINFKTRQGIFQQLGQQVSMKFPLNAYLSTLDHAQWLMDSNRLILSSVQSKTENLFDSMNRVEKALYHKKAPVFIALASGQDSLQFYAEKAFYNMDRMTIDVEGVPVIKVADAAIYPDNNTLTILPGGKIATLKEAAILTDTINFRHEIYQATVQVESKRSYKGSGTIDYTDINATKQPIRMNEIYVRNGKTIAKGNIGADEVFFLSPEYFFAGKVIMHSNRPLLRFKGGYQLNEGCVDNTNHWVSFNQELDPNHISFHLGKGAKTADSLSAYMGLAYSTYGYRFYPLVFQAKKKKADEIILSATGDLRYNPQTAAYQLGSTERLEKNDLKDNYIQLDTKKCILSGDGILNLNLNTHLFQTKTIGVFKHYIVPDSTTFDVVLMLNFHFDKQALELMADSIRFFPTKSVNISKGLYPMAVRKLLDKQTSGLLMNELSLYGQAKKIPQALKSSLTFTDLHMVWDKTSHSFISTGRIGLGYIGDASINKYVNGVLQIEKSRSGSRIQFLLRQGRQWYFFSYAKGVLQVISSDDHFNTIIEDQKDEKRILNPNSMTDYFEYVISTRQKSINFIRAMKRLGRLK